jgi:hypothetical protein
MIVTKDFYLNTPMKQSEYMQLKMSGIPDENNKGIQIE